MTEAFERFLVYYSVASLSIALIAIILTAVLLHLDKCFGLALICMEIAAYVAAATFGLLPVSQATLTVGDEVVRVGISTGDQPPYWFAVVTLMLCLCGALGFMALWIIDRRS